MRGILIFDGVGEILRLSRRCIEVTLDDTHDEVEQGVEEAREHLEMENGEVCFKLCVVGI